MTRYTFTVWLNELAVGPACLGYRPGDPLARLPETYVIEARSPIYATEWLWRIGNRVSADSLGQRWPATTRSLSVGDVAAWRADRGPVSWSAVALIGWDDIASPLRGPTATPGQRVYTGDVHQGAAARAEPDPRRRDHSMARTTRKAAAVRAADDAKTLGEMTPAEQADTVNAALHALGDELTAAGATDVVVNEVTPERMGAPERLAELDAAAAGKPAKGIRIAKLTVGGKDVDPSAPAGSKARSSRKGVTSGPMKSAAAAKASAPAKGRKPAAGSKAAERHEAAKGTPPRHAETFADCPICGFHFKRPQARCNVKAACDKRAAERKATPAQVAASVDAIIAGKPASA